MQIDKKRLVLPEDYMTSWTAEYECFEKTKGEPDVGRFKGHYVVNWDVNIYEKKR